MAMTLLTTNTSSNDATSDFTSSIDSTYKLYIFKFYDVNPATDDVDFGFQVNAAGASGFNEVITSSFAHAFHAEDDSGTPGFNYHTSHDQAQGTAFQNLTYDCGSDADQSSAGTLFLFNPSNTTYVKHFYSRTITSVHFNHTKDAHVGGYINVALAIDEVQFKMSSGNMDSVIKMYGVG